MDLFKVFQISERLGPIVPMAVLLLDSEDDRNFVSQLFLRYQKTIYYVTLEYFDQDDMDIDEAIGETIERICRYCSNLKTIPQSKMQKYIVSMTGNVCRDILRKRDRWGKIIDYTFDQENLEKISSDYDLERTVFDKASATELMEAFEMLPKREKELLRMRYIDRIPTKEIAKDLHSRENAVRTAISRARHHLQKIVDERKEKA